MNSDFSSVTLWLIEEQKGNSGIKLSSVEDKPSFHKSLASFCKRMFNLTIIFYKSGLHRNV